MKIKVLGPGCAKCKKLHAEAEKAIAASGLHVELEKIEKLEDIMKYAIMTTPALVLDEQIKATGRIVPAAEIAGWITAAATKASS